MNLEKLIVVLPCQSLEGYTLDRQADRADELLSAWSALYHPALLARAGALPTWVSAQQPPKDATAGLVMLPPSSEEILDPDWIEQAAQSGAGLIRHLKHRSEMVEAALQRLPGGPGPVDPQLAADFLALGFGYLQLEVLIRDAGYDMGTDVQYYDEQYYDYVGQFDRDRFQQETVAAASAAVKGDAQTAREHLRTAFSQLTDARRGLPYTYSADVDPHLLDLTLVAPTTLGASLRDQLAEDVPVNLLASGEAIEQMARQEPATLAALKEGLEKERVALIGGEYREQAIPLMSPESILDELRRGREAYQRHLGRQPAIFGRRRFGLSPVLPQILRKFGFTGAVHFTLDDGNFPTSRQAKIWWVGMDGSEVEALAQLPIDAGRATSFLNFASKVSNTSYNENNATAVLAHWPGHTTAWYGDLKRVAAYSPVLGEFRTISEYFEQSQSISEWTRSAPDAYRCPYLRQAVHGRRQDPISRWVRYHRRRAQTDALAALGAMADLAQGGGQQTTSSDASLEGSRELLESLQDVEETQSGRQAERDEQLRRLADEATERFGGLIPRQEAPAQHGHLLVNPWSFSRRVLVDVSDLPRLPAVEGPVRASGESAGRKQVVVEVPAMGFAWIGPESEGPEPKKKEKLPKRRRRGRSKDLPMVEENVLRNDYFEVTVNPTTGAIQGIHDYTSRGALLAQQIAMRLPRPKRSRRDGFEEEDAEKDYSLMAADRIAVISSGPVVGQLECRGRLVSRDGELLARFVETIEARRGSPILRLTIDLDVQCEPASDPWNSYYAARFAWSDEAADVYRGVSLASKPTERSPLESPHFVDVRSGPRRLTILTGGLPYHRRFGLRKLDTLLVVHGETARSFRLGIGVNLTHPVPAALDFLASTQEQAETAPPPRDTSGWLFHVDARNVIATHWSPLWSDGQLAGFRVRLLETEGRACQVSLRSFRPVRSARKVDFQGEQPSELPAEGDKITMDLKAHEWTQVEAEFG